jgi:hypothetical protein
MGHHFMPLPGPAVMPFPMCRASMVPARISIVRGVSGRRSSVRRVIANGHGLSPQTFVLLQSSLKKLRQPKKTIRARILSVCVVCCVQVVCGGGGVGEGER